MRRTTWFALVIVVVLTSTAEAQVGSPGIQYGNTIAAGDGVQLYPYDQQDPWLHGHFQRVPSYGGFSSFRPYNYRHVFAQTQLAQTWGHAHGMPYSQQFWNRYRGSYLDGNLHSQNEPVMQNHQMSVYPSSTYPSQAYPAVARPAQAYPMQSVPAQGYPNNAYPVSSVRPIGYQTQSGFDCQVAQPAAPTRQSAVPAERPIHIFPEQLNNR